MRGSHRAICPTKHQWGTNLPPAQVYYAPLMVYGASRKYWDTLHTVSLEGIGMYHEAMIPSTAIIANLKGAAIRLPKRGDTYHCCTHDASWLYGLYHNASAWCVPLSDSEL